MRWGCSAVEGGTSRYDSDEPSGGTNLNEQLHDSGERRVIRPFTAQGRQRSSYGGGGRYISTHTFGHVLQPRLCDHRTHQPSMQHGASSGMNGDSTAARPTLSGDQSSAYAFHSFLFVSVLVVSVYTTEEDRAVKNSRADSDDAVDDSDANTGRGAAGSAGAVRSTADHEYTGQVQQSRARAWPRSGVPHRRLPGVAEVGVAMSSAVTQPCPRATSSAAPALDCTITTAQVTVLDNAEAKSGSYTRRSVVRCKGATIVAVVRSGPKW